MDVKFQTERNANIRELFGLEPVSLGITCILRLFEQAVRPVVGPTQYTPTGPAPCKWWLDKPPRAFSLEVTIH